MAKVGHSLTGRARGGGQAGRAAIGGALVIDGLTGIDVPFTGRRRAGLVGALVGMVVGVVFVGIGWWVHTQNKPFPDGVTTQATVTAVRTVQNPDGRLGYSRVISFTATTGKRVTFTEGSSSSRRPEVGGVGAHGDYDSGHTSDGATRGCTAASSHPSSQVE